MADCYNGPNPIKDEDRMAIWQWAKANAIDQGLPFEKVHQAINSHFFGGQGRPEWINDVLSGRKTPYKELANSAWKAQYNRRVITQQAKNLYKDYNMHPALQTIRKAWEFPRGLVTFAHGVVFPITHGGDLMMRPASWVPFFRGTADAWAKSWSKGATERMMDSMRRDSLYTIALRSGLDIGEKSRPSGILNAAYGRALHPLDPRRISQWSDEQSARAWEALTKMRFELWKQQMERNTNPSTMSQAELLDYGKSFADWANHATGSVKMSIPHAGEVLFGPKLTASKLARLFGDPVKTLNTFANWKNATPGEQAVAWTRASGMMQYVATGLGFLAANQGLLWAFGSKQKINFTDPTQSDFLQFKGFGIEGNLGGLHSEIRTLGKLFVTTLANEKALKKEYPFGQSKYAHLQNIVSEYVMGKASPTIQRGLEVAAQENFMGRPVPWSSNPGTEKKPRMSWGEYLGSIGPIPLSETIRYFYDELRQRGSTVGDATSLIKAAIISGLSATGMKAQEDMGPKVPMRARHERAQLAR